MLSVNTLMQEARSPHPPGRGRRRSGKVERQALAVALEKLAEIPRLVLALRHCEGMHARQIARVVGLEEDAVRALLVEASREVLRGLALTPPERKPEDNAIRAGARIRRQRN